MPCEVCLKEGRRRMMRLCPEGWYYAEAAAVIDGEPNGVFVIAVCSIECRDKFFKPGPGRMTVDGKEPV